MDPIAALRVFRMPLDRGRLAGAARALQGLATRRREEYV